MGNEKLFHVGVKALIVNAEHKFLVVEADNRQFINPKEPSHGDLIGGRIDANEHPIEALHREIEEETGLTNTKVGRLLNAVVSPVGIPINPNERVGLLLLIYEVTIPDDSEIALSVEHNKFEWLDGAAAAASLEYKFGKEFSDWLRDGGGVEQH